MTQLATTILPQLPYLRRFARSLTGRQKSGDAYVASVLETLVADPSVFPQDFPVRAGLYHLFLKTWDSIDVNSKHGPDHDTDVVKASDERLEAITPKARQAFLLVALEGFSPAEGAQILGVTIPQFEQLLDLANRQIADQVATDVLIIEDEPLIALDLQTLITSLGHRVQQVARTRKEAVAAFRENSPSLVLADIQLADGSSGLDAVNDILQVAEVPVIFITAYPEQLLTGLRPEPTFLIPKPFQSEMVKAVVSQALFFNIKARSKRAA